MPAMRDHLQAYVDREEMAAAIDNPGQPGEPPRSGPIQALLARTESRLAATIDTRVRELAGELVLLEVEHA